MTSRLDATQENLEVMEVYFHFYGTQTDSSPLKYIVDACRLVAKRA